MNGTWRSLVARFLGVEEVAGSNPVVPIRLQTQDEKTQEGDLQSLACQRGLGTPVSIFESFVLGLVVFANTTDLCQES